MWLQCGFSLKTHLLSWLRGQGEERDRERREREGGRERRRNKNECEVVWRGKAMGKASKDRGVAKDVLRT